MWVSYRDDGCDVFLPIVRAYCVKHCLMIAVQDKPKSKELTVLVVKDEDGKYVRDLRLNNHIDIGSNYKEKTMLYVAKKLGWHTAAV